MDKDPDFADLYPRGEVTDDDFSSLNRENVNPTSPTSSPKKSYLFGRSNAQYTKVPQQSMATQDMKKSFKHTSALTSICVHLSQSEGQKSLIVTGRKDNSITVWDLLTAQTLFTLAGHTDSITAMCIYAPAAVDVDDNEGDARDRVPLLVSVSKDSMVRVWDLDAGDCIFIFEGHTGSVSCVSIFDPTVNPAFYDTPLVVTGGQDKVPFVWNLRSGLRMRPVAGVSEELAEGSIHSAGISAVTVFTPLKDDSRFAVPLLISCSKDKSIILWNLLSGQVIRKISDGQEKITSVAVFYPPVPAKGATAASSQKPLLITGSADKTIALWDLVACQKALTVAEAVAAPGTARKSVVPGPGPSSGSPRKSVLPGPALGLPAPRLAPLQILTGSQSIDALAVYSPAAAGAAAAPASTDLTHKALLVTVGKDKSVAIWDLAERELVKVVDVGHKSAVTALEIIQFAGGNSRPLVVTASADSSAIIWDLVKGGIDIMNVFKPSTMDYITRLKHDKNVKCAAVYSREELAGEAPPNPLLITANVSATGENVASVWDISSGERQVLQQGQELNGRKRLAHATEITAVAVYCAKKAEAKPLIVTASCDSVNVWDLDVQENARQGRFLCSPANAMMIGSTIADVVQSVIIHAPNVDSEGEPVVIIAYGSAILMIDLFSGTNSRVIRKAHMKPVSCMAVYDPPHDRCNPLLISGGRDKCVYVWDLHTEQKSSIVLKCDEGLDALELYAPEDDAISPLVLTAGGDKPTVVFWDLMSGERVRILQCGKPVQSLSIYAPRNSSVKGVMPILITGSFKDTITLWDFHTGAQIRALEGVHPKRMSCITVYPYCGADGCLPIVVSGSVDGSAVIWNLNSADSKYTKTLEYPNLQNVVAMAVHAPAKSTAMHRARIITANFDKSVYAFESLEKKIAEPVPLSKRDKMHKEVITCMSIYVPAVVTQSPLVITGSKDQTAMVYQLSDGALLHTLSGAHKKAITSLVVCPPTTTSASPQVITGSLDGTAVIWDLATGKKVRTIPENFIDAQQGITALGVYVPPEAGAAVLLVAGYADSNAIVWNLRTEKKGARLVGGHTTAIRAIVIVTMVPATAAEARYPAAITAGEDGDAVMWKLPTGEKLRVFSGGHSPGAMMISTFTAVGHSALNVLITACTNDRHVVLWDLATGKQLRRVELQAVLQDAARQARKGRVEAAQIANITAMAVTGCDERADPLAFQVCVSYGTKRTSLVTWKEMLLDYMPLPAAVQTEFNSDAAVVPINWSRMQSLSNRYATALWLENYALFKTVFSNKKFDMIFSFYKTFSEELPSVVFRLPYFEYKADRKSVLHFVIDNKMPVRHILLDAWSTAIASKCNADFVLQLFHPSSCLDRAGLLRLAAMFPMDFIEFLSKLEPVESHPLLYKGCVSYPITSTAGTIIEGTKPRISVDLWTTAGYVTDTTSSSAQPVTAYMLPLVGAANFNMLKAYIDTSLAMDNLAVFESELGEAVFRYAWQSFGKPVHVRTMLWYSMFMMVYTCSVFLFDKMQTSGDTGMEVGAWILQAAVLLFAVSLGADEVLQFVEDWEEKKQATLAVIHENDQKNELSKAASVAAGSTSLSAFASGLSMKGSSSMSPSMKSPFSLGSPSTSIITAGASGSLQSPAANAFMSFNVTPPSQIMWEPSHGTDTATDLSPLPASASKNTRKMRGRGSVVVVDVPRESTQEASPASPTGFASQESFSSPTSVSITTRPPTRVRANKRGSVMSKHFPTPEAVAVPDMPALTTEHGWAHRARTFLYQNCFNGPSQMLTTAADFISVRVQGWQSSYLWLKDPLYALCEHVSNFWNLLDVLLIVFVTAGTILRCAHAKETNQSRCVLAVASVFAWFKLLYFMRPFKSSGLLVSMILQIMYDIKYFLVILAIALTGFALAFWLISYPDYTLTFGNIPDAFLNTFQYMLGQGISADFTGTASPELGVVLLVMFMLFMMILMLNLLIALMGDSFSVIKDRGIAHWRREQACLMLEQQSMVSAAARAKHEAKSRIHLLKHFARNVDAGLTDKQLLLSVKKTLDANSQVNDTTGDAVSNKLVSLSEAQEAAEAKLALLESKIDAVLAKLTAVAAAQAPGSPTSGDEASI